MNPSPKLSTVDVFTTVYRSCKPAVNLICSLPLAHRSVLIKCCQAQAIPFRDDHDSLAKMVENLPPFIYSGPISRYQNQVITDIKDYFGQFRPYITPIRAAIILDMARGLPVSPFEIDEAREKSWKKELVCIENLRRPDRVNWETVFDPSKFDEPMLPQLKPNRVMAKNIHMALVFFRRKVRHRILFPRSSHKNMSRSTRRHYEGLEKTNLDGCPIFSQKNWLQYYHYRGIKLEGGTEMRQKWYHHGAKPRTYAAQGGLHYASSCYLQDVFTELVNSTPITNHITRLQPSRIFLRDGSHAKVYDLSTFTSNFSEQKSFMTSLTNFCYGTPVQIYDVREGLLEVDLGDLLYEYTQNCVCRPQVSLERATGDVEDDSYYHGTSSLLGIFGNLMSDTFAHGALMAQLVEDDDQVNVAGDDGIIDENEENEYEIDVAIRALGDYERDKTFDTARPPVICLKRPLHQVGSRLEQGILIIPPNLNLVLSHLFRLSDPRYEHYQSYSVEEAISLIGKDFLRFLRSAHRSQGKLDDDSLEEAIELLENVRNLICNHGRSIGRVGSLKQCGDPFFWPSTMDVETLRAEDPLQTLIRNRFRGEVHTFKCEVVERPVDVYEMPVDKVFFANSDRTLSMLVTLGYLEREDVMVWYTGQKALDALTKSLDITVPDVYEYRVIAPIPAALYV